MNDVVTIENTEMQIREYNGQRVVTFKDIDAVHHRPKGTARNAFNRNKKHFIENQDYVILKRGSEVKQGCVRLTYIPKNGVTLLTESGYLMIVKSFNDDLSWGVQRQLVNAYFKAKSEGVTNFTGQTKRIYQTSSTPVPKNPSWYHRNRRRMAEICKKDNISLSTLYHRILVRLGEEYDLEKANEIYRDEVGYVPRYQMDIVSYFPDLGRLADDFLDTLGRM